MAAKKRKRMVAVTRKALIVEARALRSAHGENPEYDRALHELIYWAAGGVDYDSVRREVLGEA
jgi:hypothetical protein